jgi:hypothetical protein
MAFERFTKTHGKESTPKVTIWRRGQIAISQGGVDKFDVKQFEFAVLFYDRETKKIGIKLTNDSNEDGAIKINKKMRSGVSISGKSFLTYYEIDFSKTIKYDVNDDKENQLLVINIKPKR